MRGRRPVENLYQAFPREWFRKRNENRENSALSHVIQSKSHKATIIFLFVIKKESYHDRIPAKNILKIKMRFSISLCKKSYYDYILANNNNNNNN